MKPFDKFGSPIYDSTYRKLLIWGEKLEQSNYKESSRKPNLFYRVAQVKFGNFESKVSYYTDMRGTKIVRIWEDPVPLFYVYYDSPSEVPFWVINRTITSEMERLEKNGIVLRSSWYYDDSLYDRSYLKAMDSNLSKEEYVNKSILIDLFENENGSCKQCGLDFFDSGLFCSEECKMKFVHQSKIDFMEDMQATLEKWTRCEICDIRVYSNDNVGWINAHEQYGLPPMRKLHEHHIDYKNDRTIVLCANCHGKVTKQVKELERFQPIDSKPEIRRIYKLIPCSSCDGKSQVPFDSTETVGLCYRCTQKQNRKETRKRPAKEYYYSRRALEAK